MILAPAPPWFAPPAYGGRRRPAPGPLVKRALGLDLGQAQDFTALALVEARPATEAELPAGQATRLPLHFTVPSLRRWPLGTSYTAIVADLLEFCRLPALEGACLVIDSTGVGAPVVEMVNRAFRAAAGRGGIYAHGFVSVLITAGHEVAWVGDARWNVPKKTLVSALQVALQTRRLSVSRALSEAALLAKELQNFRARVTLAASETLSADWREGQHDDLVLAVALAVWALEKVDWPTVADAAPPHRKETRA